MSRDVRVRQAAPAIVDDDGTDGIFWRNGDRWLRERGKEIRLLDLAPELEGIAMMELLLKPETIDAQACERSKGEPRA